MCSELQRLEQQLTSVRAALRGLPEGKLVCVRNKSYFKWFHSDGHSNTYLPRRNRQLAEQLAIKKYLQLQEADILREQKAINAYLKHHRTCLASQQLLAEDSGYSQLLSPYFQTESEELQQWANAPYDRNTAYPEHLVHHTCLGFPVRSKSEAIIVMLLHANRIPFRYECALELGDTTIYPDFTIRHPRTGKIFYWEHFGMMDDPTYSKNAFSRLQLYASEGIYPSLQLLTTYETQETPFNSVLATDMIRYYFL